MKAVLPSSVRMRMSKVPSKSVIMAQKLSSSKKVYTIIPSDMASFDVTEVKTAATLYRLMALEVLIGFVSCRLRSGIEN